MNVLNPPFQCNVLIQNGNVRCRQGPRVNICDAKRKSSQSKRGAVPIFFFHILYILPVLPLSIHLLLFLRAGVSSLAAVLVLVQCSCGVRLVSLPALQSHPWLELGGESLQSHVPETLLCAPQD